MAHNDYEREKRHYHARGIEAWLMYHKGGKIKRTISLFCVCLKSENHFKIVTQLLQSNSLSSIHSHIFIIHDKCPLKR